MRHIFLNLKRFDIPKEYGGGKQYCSNRRMGKLYCLQYTGATKKVRQRRSGICYVFARGTLDSRCGSAV